MAAARKQPVRTELTEVEREVLVTARVLLWLTGPSILQEDGDAAAAIGKIAVEINNAALKAAGTPA